jgi:flagellar L-ring protein FlgH
MKRGLARDLIGVGAAAVIVAGTGGCSMITRLSEVGDYPQMTPITNPQSQPGYRPVNLPMPAPMPAEDNPNSLWRRHGDRPPQARRQRQDEQQDQA